MASFLSFGLVAGCGAQDDGQDDALGSTEEAYTSSFSQASRILGEQENTSPSQSQCSSNPPSGAVCLVPASKANWHLCVTSLTTLGRAAVQLAASVMANVNASNFSFTVDTGVCNTSGNVVMFLNSAEPGATDADITHYSNFQWLDAEPALSESLPGTYVAQHTALVGVDEAKLSSLGGTSQIQKNRYVQVAEYQLGKAWGLGRTGCGTATPHPPSCGAFADAETNRPLLPVQKCLMNNFVTGGTTFSVTGTNCGNWPSGV